MPTYMGQTVDLWEDFEDALGGEWTETDGSGLLNPADDTAEYNGTYGMSVNNASASQAHIRTNIGSDKTAISFGFWVNTGASFGAWAGGTIIMEILDGGETGYTLQVHREQNADIDNRIDFRLRGTDLNARTSAITDSTWYWVTGHVQRNDTCTFRCYGTDHVQVGSDITCTGNDYAIRLLYYGKKSSGSFASTMLFDDLVVDWTDATFPLLGWATGAVLAGSVSGASSTSSLLPYIYHYLINNTVSGVSSLQSLLPYVYHYLINNAVSAVSSISNLTLYLYRYLINNTVNVLSTIIGNLSTTSGEILHALAGAINAISSIGNVLPYITRRLLPDTVDIVSSLVGNLETFKEQVYQVLAGAIEATSSMVGNLWVYGIRLLTGAVDAVASTYGNLSHFAGGMLNKLRIYMKIHRGRF